MAADTKPDFIDGDQTGITMVRLHNADDAGAKTAWPANEIDENATRYIDFAVTAPATAEVRITNIKMDIASHSTATMCYHLNVGFNEGFTGVQTLAEKVNMTNVTIEHLSLTPALTIPAGETLHVRVLPWHDAGEAKSGKYICLKEVKIEGQAFGPGEQGIENAGSQVKAIKVMRNGQLFIIRNGEMYNMQGNIVKTL